MALDELFTYLGIGEFVCGINDLVKNSAKPANVGKTVLEYDIQKRISKVGRLKIKYYSNDRLKKIGNLVYSPDWLNLAERLGKSVQTSSNITNYVAACSHLNEREFDWRFANYGVAVFACDCNNLRFTKSVEQPLRIEKNLISYDQDNFVTDVGGLKVEYGETDPFLRESSPDVVGGIVLGDPVLISLNIIKEADLIDG